MAAKSPGEQPKRPRASESTPVSIPKLDIKLASIKLVGDSPLIVHAWSEKSKRMMLDKQMKKPTPNKEAKNPEEDYRQSLYIHPDGGYGFPSVGFKSSAVDACSQIDGMTKVQTRGAFHVIGDLVKIDGDPTPREDMVRVGMGTADIRYRGEFKTWSCRIDIRYNANVMTLPQIVNLFNTAGFAVGVGEWRPERNGSFGMFHVV